MKEGIQKGRRRKEKKKEKEKKRKEKKKKKASRKNFKKRGYRSLWEGNALAFFYLAQCDMVDSYLEDIPNHPGMRPHTSVRAVLTHAAKSTLQLWHILSPHCFCPSEKSVRFIISAACTSVYSGSPSRPDAIPPTERRMLSMMK
jgi:hypothetical protein